MRSSPPRLCAGHKASSSSHRNPERPWTIAGLAKEAGVSRSVLAERFRHYLGEPPMSTPVGAEMLASTSHAVAQVAAEVGYESEAAFNRAFKRKFEVPPARYRIQLKSVQAKQARLEKLR